MENTSRPPWRLHVDLDGARHIFAAHGWSYGSQRDSLWETGIEAALELFSNLDVRATLFVIAEDVGDRGKARLLRQAVELGHEIASHSMSHRRLDRLTPVETRREIFDSRSLLVDCLGVDVPGFRAPAFVIDLDCLRLVAEAGYSWDSSLFAGQELPGLPGKVAAGTHGLAGIADLIELPLPRYRPLPFPFHPSYAFVLGLWYFRAGLRRVQGLNEPLNLLFHLTEFSVPLERGELPSARARIMTLSHLSQAAKLARCRRVLEQVRKEYRMASIPSLSTDLEV